MFQTNLILKDVAQKDITLGSRDIAISAVFVTCMQCSAEEMSSGIGYSSRWMCRGNQMVLGVCFHPPKCLKCRRSLMWVVFREFAKEKERVESRAGFMALKEQQKLEKELTGYVDWICRYWEVVKYQS